MQVSSHVLEKMVANMSVGLDKGHAVTKREIAPRPGSRKGVRMNFILSGCSS